MSIQPMDLSERQHPQDAPQPRPASVLMKPARLSVMQASRLSTTRLLMAKAIRGRWKFTCLDWDIDERSSGTALYRIDTGEMAFDFIVHSFEPAKEGRNGRIIGGVWDMMAALVEGPVSAEDVRTTGKEIKKLYAGRATPGTLVWARSNRSSRVFEHTVDALAHGRQPDIGTLAEVCYLMRNTGLDGNGTFGTRSFRALEPNHPLRRPLDAQMLSAYMMRVFSIDLVNHLARCRNVNAAKLAPEIQRFLGVGNGSALGLVLFVNNHPHLVHHWIASREKAIVAAERLPVGRGDARLAHLLALLDRAITFRAQDRMDYERFAASRDIASELQKIRHAVQALYSTGLVNGVARRFPLYALAQSFEETIHEEAVETFLGLLTELTPELCDQLAEQLGVDEEFTTEPQMTVGHLRNLLHDQYGWSFEIDIDSPAASKYVWYKSATAEEPRRGPKEEAGDVHNLALDLPRLVRELDEALAVLPPEMTTARFLLERPALRFIVSRVQTLDGLAYHSPQMNMMGEDLIPCDITRFINIGIHGIDKTRDYQQRALRGVMYQGAPTVEDIASGTHTDWFHPEEPQA
ncbi:hypothetical protein SRS16P3_00229 (plasmid) [Variovorax sp. SRS16]|uniref:hypothetical protein n=1 Tax=Variovorax sp. SRS16 TaxID=282217 RepID=UPI001315B7A2|nr:hypothetical protein [Variovorax sp. SRS16]VTU46517.1 hypothetical protein SRS16P3_00229 [Variovorax sp. SRS16]